MVERAAAPGWGNTLNSRDDSGFLVLGTAIGYSAEQIAPFLDSLRASGYAGGVALVVSRSDLVRFRPHPLFAGVSLIGATQWLPLRFRGLQKAPARRWLWRPLQLLIWTLLRGAGHLPLPERARWRLQIPLAEFLYPPTESRFLRYHTLLRKSRHTRILLSDVRDVVFQRDPAAALPAQGLAISLEVPDYTIGTEPWNRSRVTLIYGETVLGQVSAQPVSCSGVTAGDIGAMRRYLELMVRDIVGLNWSAARQGWFDQAIHNVILRTHWKEPLQGLGTLTSAVATLGAVPDASLRLDAEGRLLNNDGSIVSVVHQYDRKPALRLRFPGPPR